MRTTIAATTIATQHAVTLEHVPGNDHEYVVTYGHSITEWLDSYEAVKEFQSCIAHAMTCAGLLDDEEDAE